MTRLEILKKGYEHLTNEMLDQIIDWWMVERANYEKDILLPRLIEEKLNRSELHYE